MEVSVKEYSDILTDIVRKLDSRLVDLPVKNSEIESEVINYVCLYFGQNVVDIKSRSRRREHVIARQVSMYFIHEQTHDNRIKYTLKYIGNLFGNRDHSTVIHAKQTVQDLIDVDKYFANNIKLIRENLKLIL